MKVEVKGVDRRAGVTARAAVLEAVGEVVLTDIVLDAPHDDEVLVRVAAAGVCHSDLHLVDGGLGTDRLPIVLGHEGAGVVEAVGSRVRHVAPGDQVAFCIVPRCGSCAACRAGRFHLCTVASAHAYAGTLMDGTCRASFPDGRPLHHFNFVSCLAERCVVPAGAAIRLAAGVPLWQAALLGCAVTTGVGAVRNTAHVRVGDSVCVVGCGGVGLHIVAGARIAGAARIIAVDRGAEKLERARVEGATDIVDAARSDVVAAVLERSGGGVDHAFEAVGTAGTIRTAWDVLRPGGTAVVVGLTGPGVEVSLPARDLLSEKTLRGCLYGSANAAEELPQLVELVLQGRIDLAGAVSHVTGLDGLTDAFERLRRGEGARTVVLLDEGLAGRTSGTAPAV